MMDVYSAEAHIDGGSVLSVEGTIAQCANWADNVIRCEGACTIDIRRKDRKGEKEAHDNQYDTEHVRHEGHEGVRILGQPD